MTFPPEEDTVKLQWKTRENRFIVFEKIIVSSKSARCQNTQVL